MKRFVAYGRQFLSWFTAVFTGVILAGAVFIGIYSNPYLPLRLVAQAIALAAAAALLNFLFVTEKPLYKRALAARTLVHFALLLSTVTACAWRFGWFSFAHAPSVLTFLLLFLAVYGAIWLANFFRDLLDERIINERLRDYRPARGAGEGQDGK